MRKRTYIHDSNMVLEDDASVLRRPLITAFPGFEEAKSAFENGTEEVRRLLLHECSLIYECNVCRNLFRNLANFISHKRIFCHDSSGCHTNGYHEPNSTVLIQTTEPDRLKPRRSTAISPVIGEPPAKVGGDSVGTLHTVIDCVKHEQKPAESISLQLDGVRTSGKAVCQTPKHEEIKHIKVEAEEVRKLVFKKDETVLGPESRTVTQRVSENSGVQAEINVPPESPARYICEKCNATFQTEKTLKIHIQKKHIHATHVYQCPVCQLTFLQPAAVIRHLTNEHKKPANRIRLMRDTILKRRVQQGDVQAKGPSREVKSLQLSENSEDDLHIEQQRKAATCVYCGKTFERRAVLATHLINCHSKLEPQKKFKTKRLQLQVEENLPSIANSAEPAHARIAISEVIPTVPTTATEPLIKQEVEEDFDLLNEMFANLGKKSFGPGLQTVTLDKLEDLEGDSTNASNAEDGNSNDENSENTKPMKRESITNEKTDAPDIKAKRKFRTMPAPKHLKCRCKLCNKQFNALSNLRRHISMFHYRARRFGCTLCEYRAFRRYDIVNHLGFVHKMKGDRQEMALEYVSVHEVEYSKDDVDGDIVVMTDETETQSTLAEQKRLKSHEKNAKRKKPLLSAGSEDDCEPKRTKLKRSLSQQAISPTEGTSKLQKRPIRNRIKPNNKDFVYDLSNLIKGETPASERDSLRNLRRRNTLCNSADNLSSHSKLSSVINMHCLEPLIGASKDLIKGAARRISLLMINQGLAVSATLPEIPTERPQIRPRLICAQSADMSGVAIIETSDLDDIFLEKISCQPNDGFKMKPCLELQHSTLSSLLRKVDSSLHCVSARKDTPPSVAEDKVTNENSEIAPATEIDAITQETASSESASGSDTDTDTDSDTDSDSDESDSDSDTELSATGDQFTDPELLIPLSSSPPPTPRKRVTLMERLAENKAKRRDDSVLRTTLD